MLRSLWTFFVLVLYIFNLTGPQRSDVIVGTFGHLIIKHVKNNFHKDHMIFSGKLWILKDHCKCLDNSWKSQKGHDLSPKKFGLKNPKINTSIIVFTKLSVISSKSGSFVNRKHIIWHVIILIVKKEILVFFSVRISRVF